MHDTEQRQMPNGPRMGLLIMAAAGERLRGKLMEKNFKLDTINSWERSY